ncbi:MAG: hypothetical protein R3E08_14800 [Thiotrichaceae bacterium]
MRWLVYFWIAFIGLPFSAMAIEATTDDVYAKVYQVNQEVQQLKQFKHIDKVAEASNLTVALTPGHNWQKAYEILYKINIFRQNNGLPFIAVPSREPLLKLPPMISYEQMERIVSELQILKYYFGITEELAPTPTFVGKSPTDVYNLLNEISSDFDLLNGKNLTPSNVMTQAVRISEDVNFIMEALGIKNTTIPPKKNIGVQPGGAFDNFVQLLVEIKRIQKLIGLSGVDFYAFKPTNRVVTPSDVFSIGGIALAELQPIKAYLGLKYALTPMAEYYEGMQPADVQQLVGWNIRKLQLISTIEQK